MTPERTPRTAGPASRARRARALARHCHDPARTGGLLPGMPAFVSPLAIPFVTRITAVAAALASMPDGAIAKLGRDLLLVTGSGEWYGVNSAGRRLVGRRLSVPAPMQRDGSSFESSRCRCDGSPDWR
jgi:hypothetical protein